MKFSKIHTLLFGAAFAFAISSCEEEAETDSIKQTFAEYSATLATAPLSTTECGNVYTLTFAFPDKQNTDVTLEVHTGESSTATEGVDFDLITHEVTVPAFAGQDSFDVEIAVYQDFKIESGGKEQIYLTFTSSTPSGIKHEDVMVAEIEDSGIEVEASAEAEFALSWAYTADPSADACHLDLDLTFQPTGTTDPYDAADLLGYGLATTACVEEGPLAIEDMVEGEIYDIWVVAWGGEAAQNLTVTLDYARENSAFEGTLDVTGVFNSGMVGDAAIIGTLEKNCNVVTLKDASGNVVAEGRVKAGKSLRTAHVEAKPF